MKIVTHRSTQQLVDSISHCKNQLFQFLETYDAELIEKNLSDAFSRVIPASDEIDALSPAYLFYEELNVALRNCRSLYRIEKDRNTQQLLDTRHQIEKIVAFIKQVAPVAYIFHNPASTTSINLTLVTHQYLHKPFEDIQSLLDFMIEGNKRVSCTVYSFGAIHDLLQRGHIYFSSICKPENCVFQHDEEFDLPQLSAEKCNILVDSTKGIFQENLKQAITFYRGASSFIRDEETNMASFMLQQACEMTYRTLLLVFKGRQLKCHDLVVLRKHVLHFLPGMAGVFSEYEAKEVKMLETIQEAYIRCRYEPSYRSDTKRIPAIMNMVWQLIQRARNIFEYHCQQIKLLA